MSQFIFIIRNQGVPMANMTEAETAEHMQKWGAWMGELAAQGKLDGGLPLSMQSGAVMTEGGHTISDGIYYEGNEINVGGYLLIQAGDLQEAITIAKGCPANENPTGSIEIRECLEMEQPA